MFFGICCMTLFDVFPKLQTLILLRRHEMIFTNKSPFSLLLGLSWCMGHVLTTPPPPLLSLVTPINDQNWFLIPVKPYINVSFSSYVILCNDQKVIVSNSDTKSEWKSWTPPHNYLNCSLRSAETVHITARGEGGGAWYRKTDMEGRW